MGRKKKVTLPDEGAAFAVPLEGGRFGVCRVIRRATAEEAKRMGEDGILVACSAWIGGAVPEAQDPALRPILHLTHHAWKGQPDLLWVSAAPPESFIPIGTIEATADERAIECLTSGGWPGHQVLRQWRWDHERETVLREDEAKKKLETQQREHAKQAQDKQLAGLTLEELRHRTFFPSWKRTPSRKAIRASRQIMTDTVEQLLALGRAATQSQRMALLQRCIERFNVLDAELDYFIATIEREDICEEFEQIVHACGLGEHKDLADEWRDW